MRSENKLPSLDVEVTVESGPEITCFGVGGPRGPRGPQGPPGEKGDKGDPGEPGSSNITTFTDDEWNAIFN